jgi:hypothetical protein
MSFWRMRTSSRFRAACFSFAKREPGGARVESEHPGSHWAAKEKEKVKEVKGDKGAHRNSQASSLPGCFTAM